MSGRLVLAVWVLWIVLLELLARTLGDVGIAIPLPTSVVVALSRTLGLIAYPVLSAPPIVLTIIWWRRRRRAAVAPG